MVTTPQVQFCKGRQSCPPRPFVHIHTPRTNLAASPTSPSTARAVFQIKDIFLFWLSEQELQAGPHGSQPSHHAVNRPGLFPEFGEGSSTLHTRNPVRSHSKHGAGKSGREPKRHGPTSALRHKGKANLLETRGTQLITPQEATVSRSGSLGNSE